MILIPDRNFFHELDDSDVSGGEYFVEFVFQFFHSFGVIADLIAHQPVEIGGVWIQSHRQIIGHFIRYSFNYKSKLFFEWGFF